MLGKVYLFRSRTERKVYVGQTTQIEGERWSQHILAAFCGSTTPFHQAIRRLGPGDFEEETLAIVSTRSQLDKTERRFISEYKALDSEFGYNVAQGGAGSRRFEFSTEDGVRVAAKLLDPRSKSFDPKAKAIPIPLFDCYGFEIGSIPVGAALEMHGVHLDLRAKGTGRNRRFTSAKLYARVSVQWAPRYSGGFIVLQLIKK